MITEADLRTSSVRDYDHFDHDRDSVESYKELWTSTADGDYVVDTLPLNQGRTYEIFGGYNFYENVDVPLVGAVALKLRQLREVQ